MDSAGAYFPEDVTAKIGLLAEKLEIPVGFHAHDNLGLSIANSLAAIDAGARIIDGTAKGFGAGAGNAPLELLAAILGKRKFSTRIDLYKALDAGETGFGIIMNGTAAFNASSNPGRPICAAPFTSDVAADTFDKDIFDGKAVILKIDNSVVSANINPPSKKVTLNGKLLLDTSAGSLFEGSSPTWSYPVAKP
jgi:hypothetical protein